MYRTPQHVYASNLLREQTFGYPLRNPEPALESDTEGVQIGDVGYVGNNGEFNRILNIRALPTELQNRFEAFSFEPPSNKRGFKSERVFMAGIKRNLESQRAKYVFNMTSSEGAILVLPDGAVRSELEDNKLLNEIREYAARWAYRWCRFSRRDSLYLVTAVYKSPSWTLGSFSNGSPGIEILVHRQPCESGNTPMYLWEYEIPVDDQQGPENNLYFNQTVLIKGFKVTVKKGWIPIVEWLERINWQFARAFTRPCSTILQQLLTSVEVILPLPLLLNLSQPQHPLDIINSVILEKNRRAPIAITHDNDWIKMVERGLSRADLLHEDQIREFVIKEHMWKLDSNNAVYLRNTLEDSNGGRELTRDTMSLSEGGGPRLSIKNMRLESVVINHMHAGVCILIQLGSTTWRTQNKPHASVVEWDEGVTLPSDVSVSVAVCGVFQIGSMLGTREISVRQTINSRNLSSGIHVVGLSAGYSLLITLGQHFSLFETLSSREEKSEFAEKTNLAFEVLYSYYDDCKGEQLERAHDLFEGALDRCPFGSVLHAIALFNLATLKLIRCQARGTYSEIGAPITLYEKALESRGSGHPDRPATLLLLAQALLSRLGHEYEESTAQQIMDLLAEIPSDSDREYQTANAISRTCRFHQAVNSRNTSEVDSLLRNLDRDEYVPPYGYFDEACVIHMLGVALWERFRRSSDLGDLDKSIGLNKEALLLIPDGHEDKAGIVDCLGRSYMKSIETRGDLMDVDMSADLVELGERVVTALGDIPTAEDIEAREEIRHQVALMSAADTAMQRIEEKTPRPRTSAIQGLIIEWHGDDIPTRCKRQLGVLLSFLRGEGKNKVCELLPEAKADWRKFEGYKIKETVCRNEELMVFHKGFQRRCREILERLGDNAMDSENYKEAAEYLSMMLSLEPEDRVNILIKRSRARALMKSWNEVLSDADEIVDLNPSSHYGYRLRHAAFRVIGRSAEAVEAFDTMVSKLNGSPGEQYADPVPEIRSIVEGVVRPTPRVLIDTATGRLHDKQQQVEAFSALPTYDELVSLMMIKLDEAHIREAVEDCYRYVMFSHKWGTDEPVFQQVKEISIYDLGPSPGNTKLQKFCSLARERGFRWAWSDTCCIDKGNSVILQESLVSMFKWYHGSSLTIVHLLGVLSASQLPGGLRRSIWNTRAWTYQEYVAAKIVLFYTQDWYPYLGIEESNHKELPAIISEMQQATGVAAPELAVPRPGLDRVREKLYLASMRETTLEEDAAYSLFGIFNAALPVIYGEGNRAVGRLLDHILTGSGDVSILAWTGTSGHYNSYLPRDLTVYDQVVPSHIPLPMEEAEMNRITKELRSSLLDLSVLMELHKRLDELPSPSVAANRLRLACIACSIIDLAQTSESRSETGQHRRAYLAKTSMFGDIKIETGEDLTGMVGLCLVHPWIRPLLDQEHSEGGAQLDKTLQALRLVAHLKQPFGALLFVQLSRVEYRRVAADSLIMAQIDEGVSLEELIESIRTIEVQ